jgi:hypothetical protein
MPDLISEYRTHINSDFVLPSDEGVVFFDFQRQPHSIAVVSSPSRALTVCPEQCAGQSRGKMVLEILTPSLHSTALPYEIMLHTHIHPDTDLINFCSKFFSSDIKPFPIVSRQDAESWFWNFFEATAIYKMATAKHKIENLSKDSLTRFLQNVMNANNLHKWWSYYMDLYVNILASRRYLHFKKFK